MILIDLEIVHGLRFALQADADNAEPTAFEAPHTVARLELAGAGPALSGAPERVARSDAQRFSLA